MSNSQASSIGSENFDGSSIVDEDNENFRTKNGTLWRKESKLGEGGYSEVYLYKNGGSTCAVKRMPNINAGGRMTPAELEKEKAALIKFSGRDHFVSFLGWFAESDIEYFVLEYVEFGDLESNLRRREKNRRKTLRKQGKTGREIKRAETCLPEAEVKTILTQILKGLEFLHADGYIHRDLKPQNILVAQKGPDWQVKITDLGLSKSTLGEREGFSFTGTLAYMAPEIYGSIQNTSHYTDMIDIWAVGCIACRMLTGGPPFLDSWVLSQYLRVIEESKYLDQLREVPYISKDLAELLRTQTSKGLFMRQLLEPEPKIRLSASQALGHPWVRGHDFYALRGHARAVKGVAFSPDGKLLVSRSYYKTMRLWSVEERKTKHILESPEPFLLENFLCDSVLVSLVGSDKSAIVWDTETGKIKHTLKRNSKRHGYGLIACSPDGKLVAATLDYYSNETWTYKTVWPSGKLMIDLWDKEKGEKEELALDANGTEVHGITFSSNGELMLLGCSSETVRLWSTGKKPEEHILFKHSRGVRNVAFSPDGQFIAFTAYEAVWLWDTVEKKVKLLCENRSYSVNIIIFSPGGKLATTELHCHEIRLYMTRQEKEMHILKGHSDRVTSVAFSPDSQLLASASEDKTVRLWAVGTGTELAILKAHTDTVWNVTFSPKGELVATGSSDGIVGLWNVSQWKQQ